MLVEMNDMYVHSVKSSIAEYVLLNPKERERLQVALTRSPGYCWSPL